MANQLAFQLPISRDIPLANQLVYVKGKLTKNPSTRFGHRKQIALLIKFH